MKNLKEMEYLGNPDELKEKIARMEIDMTGTIQNKTVLARVLRGRELSLEYYQNGYDGYNDQERFWYVFPVYFYKDMPSGQFVREGEEGFYLVDENDKTLQQIDENDLKNDLINDLVERNYQEFNDNWNEFLTSFQKWIDAGTD
jgi:hypothetical protein